ncbi:MAG: histidine kinase [Flavobacteriales bacterium]|nr:histidine kinase [Flavobacteriales bacterium]
MACAILCMLLAMGAAWAQATGPERYDAAIRQALAEMEADAPAAAVEHGQQALTLARELRDTVRILEAMYLLMKFNVEDRHYDEADRLRRNLLALAQHYGKDAELLAKAYNAMGSMYSRRLQPDSAEQQYRAGLQVLGHGGDRELRQALLGNLASTLGETGRHAEAIAMHRQALALMDGAKAETKAWGLTALAQSLLAAGRHSEAIHQLHLADSLNRASGDRLDLAIDLAELRADAMDSLGDIGGAYAMLKRVRDLQDTLFERSLDEHYLELEKRFEARLKEEEIQRLGAETREQAERLHVRNLQLYAILALALTALTAAGLVWRNLRLKRRHATALERLNDELKGQQERIAEINRLLELKVLRARMDPHFIYNSITAIGVLARKGNTPAAVAYLDGFARLMRMVLDHGVRDSVTIHDELDFLRHYLQLEALRFEGGLHYTVEADSALLDDDARIPSLLVQPFVENAVWHGLAPRTGDRRVQVRFAEVADAIHCTVEDNGVGRAAAVRRSHPDGSSSMGVRLSDERLQLIRHFHGQQAIRYDDLQHPDGSAAGTRVVIRLG